MTAVHKITILATLGLVDGTIPSETLSGSREFFREDHERYAPRGPAASKALLFGRLPFDLPSFVVPTLSAQWGKLPGSSSYNVLQTPTGLARDALSWDAAQDWLLAQPEGLRAGRLATQNVLSASPNRLWWLPTEDGFWPGEAKQVTSGGIANILIIDDETRLDPGEQPTAIWSDYAIDDLVAAADLTTDDVAALKAGEFSRGTARQNPALWRLNDVLHQRVASELAQRVSSFPRVVASNHQACLPCLWPSYHAGQYNQSPAGCGAPLNLPGALSSVKCYGAGFAKPGIWDHATGEHVIRDVPETTAQLVLAHNRLCSVEAASRQSRAIWLQCRDENAWMLTPAGYEVMLAGVLSSLSNGLLIITQEGKASVGYSQQWYEQLGRAIGEVNEQLRGESGYIALPELLDLRADKWTLRRTAVLESGRRVSRVVEVSASVVIGKWETN